jgi:acyl-CoA synthetase (AMP-forming)/AMP-acid ligase II
LLAGAEMRVVDPATGQDAAAGQPGEFWFRSAQRMMGYLNKPDDTAQAITEDGWLCSGDIGHVGDGGFLFVSDRVKDMIITGGENVYSPEVEQAVAGHPAVAEVAVIGVPDDHWGETVKAMVVLRPGQQATRQEIIGFTRERLAHYKCPRTVDIIDALPRNPSGKVLKRALRAPHWEGRDRQIWPRRQARSHRRDRPDHLGEARQRAKSDGNGPTYMASDAARLIDVRPCHDEVRHPRQ